MELFVIAMILALSGVLGLAAARTMLSAVLFLMMRQRLRAEPVKVSRRR